MANVYVDSNAAGAGTGADWANAYTTLGAATAAKAAGDVFFVAHNHAESAAAAKNINFPGTAASPNYCYCVTSAGSVPPVAADLRTTATITTTGANAINLGGYVYCYGVTFSAGSGASNASIQFCNTLGSELMWFQSCGFVLGGTGTSSRLNQNSASGQVTFSNTTATFNSTSQAFAATGGGGPFIWLNTPSALGGATIPTTLFNISSAGNWVILLDGVDLSAMGSGKTLFPAITTAVGRHRAINCKLGASSTFTTTPSAPGAISDLILCDSGDTNYRQERYTYAGTLTTETTYVRDGGASDGTTPISWKVVTTANAEAAIPFECFPIAVWNETVGSSVTATIEIESATTLTDKDVWAEFSYLGTSGYPLASGATTGVATPLSTATNLPSSSVTWNGGLGSAVKQYLQVSFTPQEKGDIRAVVKVAKASQTLYIDPKITLT